MKRLFPFVLVLLVFATRLPIIYGHYFVADGDEAIIGLMAQEITEKGDFKVYFWGQQYGLSVVETSMEALAFKLFGENVYTLKLAMLFLWAMGCLLLYAAVKQIGGWQTAVLFSVLLIVFPGWGLWSMKARGGYITAFLFSALAAWLMSHIYTSANRKKLAHWLLLGICLAIVWYAQKLWLLSMFPFLVMLLAKKRNWAGVGLLALGIAAIAFLIPWLARNQTSDFWGYHTDTKLYILFNLPRFFLNLHVHFGGAYFLANMLHGGAVNEAVAWAWTGVFVLLLLVQLARIIARRIETVSLAAFFAACMGLFALFNNHDPDFNFRYLLPIDVPLLLCFAWETLYWLSKVKIQKVYPLVLLVLAVFNYWGLYGLRNAHPESINEPPAVDYNMALQETIGFLENKDIHYTFSPNAALFWQIMFYSHKEVMSRYFPGGDRNPEYTHEVTNAFNAGKPVALVDRYNSADLDPKVSKYKLNPYQSFEIEHQIRVYIFPDRELLEQMQFDLK